MSKVNTKVLFCSVCSAFVAVAAQGVVMPVAERTATVDGKIVDGEYDEAVTLGPFSRLHPLLKWHRWDSQSLWILPQRRRLFFATARS